MILGIDFDNTIINYENVFRFLAKKKKLIPVNYNKDKNSIRNYLRRKKREDEWTILQGEVYGKGIMEAEIFEGFKETILLLSKENIKIKIISHKTKYPYLGEKIDLRVAAKKWMEVNIFRNLSLPNISKRDVFFENSIEDKINKIIELRCDIFVDDLPEILDLLPDNIKKVLFTKKINKKYSSKFKILNNWKNFHKLII
tara:strand:- start:348 stop:944 length:597 start_codon:yes stop_codon:yes gene_type:complete